MRSYTTDLRVFALDLPRGEKIVPPDHRFCHTHGDGTICLDADMIADGDMLMCPKHPERVLFVFGTGWWEMVDKSDTGNNPVWEIRCSECNSQHKVTAWSYQG